MVALSCSVGVPLCGCRYCCALLMQASVRRWRGRLNTMVQTGTFTGLVIASAINVGTNHLIWGWRLSLGLAAVPGLILLLGAPGQSSTHSYH